MSHDTESIEINHICVKTVLHTWPNEQNNIWKYMIIFLRNGLVSQITGWKLGRIGVKFRCALLFRKSKNIYKQIQ